MKSALPFLFLLLLLLSGAARAKEAGGTVYVTVLDIGMTVENVRAVPSQVEPGKPSASAALW
jgi:hypothetical protein